MTKNPDDLDSLRQESAGLDTRAFVHWALRSFGPLGFATSLGAEDQALLWLVQQDIDSDKADSESIRSALEVFSLDTGRLPQETYDLLQTNKAFFNIPIAIYFPKSESVEALVARGGPNLFYDSLRNRKDCCGVRKVEPLKRALAGKNAWLTGLRRSQSSTRTDLERVEWDESHGIFKLNPLADWSSEQVWALIREHAVPYNALHDKGYPSLGCAPCTRAVKPGEDERAGRWWWEQPENKECGIHVQEGTPAPVRTFAFNQVKL